MSSPILSHIAETEPSRLNILLQESVDLAIVGCGVSGAAAAISAVKNGISVAVLEDHKTVGEPSHCSGHVGILAFKHFAPSIPREIIENEVKGAVLYAPNGKSLTLFRDEPVTWVLNRAEFDRHLASIATKSGVRLHLESPVDGFRRSDNGRIRLRIRGSDQREISCRMVIDAAGVGGSISRCAGLPQPNSRLLVNSAQFYAEDLNGVNENFVEVYFGQQYAPGFFGWIIPRRDGSAKIGIAARSRTNVRQCLERFIKKHPIVSGKLRRTRFLTAPMFHPIPISGAKARTYAEGILTVGDAASQVKPTTGGGIVFGLACGQIAGETAARAALKGDTSSAQLSGYEKAWRQLIGFDLHAMTWLRRLLYRLSDEQFDRIFRIAHQLEAEEILNRAADIDFQGKTMLSLARDPRFFITILSASVLSFPSLLLTSSDQYGEFRD